jgi:release factor H-coupled RctB family protein
MLHGLDDPWSGSVTDWLAGYGIRDSSPFDQSLGTVGAGNHFAEICTIERIVDETAAERLGVIDEHVYLLGEYHSRLSVSFLRLLIHWFCLFHPPVHTGSRGLGGSILANHTAEESNPYLPPDSPQLQPYLTEHDYAVQWAIANRDLVAHRIKQCLFPSTNDTDNDLALGPLPSRDLRKVLDVTHNSVTRHTLTFAGERKEVWVHRKGAAPGDKGIAPCPGSRGHLSWLLEPMGDGEYNG